MFTNSRLAKLSLLLAATKAKIGLVKARTVHGGSLPLRAILSAAVLFAAAQCANVALAQGPNFGQGNGLLQVGGACGSPSTGECGLTQDGSANPASNVIILDTFAGTSGTTITNHTPNFNAPGGVYTKLGGPGNVALTGNNQFQVGPSDAAVLPIGSSGAYTRPTLLTLSAGLEVNTNGPDNQAFRGIGVGFFSTTFNGGFGDEFYRGLVLNPNGTLTLSYAGADETTKVTLVSVAWPSAALGAFSTTIPYTLTYTVNSSATTGGVYNVSVTNPVTGVTDNADYAAIDNYSGANILTTANTPFVGIMDTSALTGTFGYASNFQVTATNPNVLYAVADTSNRSGVFGAAQAISVIAGNGYAGITSTVTGGNGAANPINNSNGGPVEFTTATILAGVDTGANPVTVTMAWRARTLSETPTSQGGAPISPPLPAGPKPLVSDVMQLTRTDELIGSTPTSPYALQMTYDASTLGSIAQQNLAVSRNFLFLAWLDPNGGGAGVAGWDNAILGNAGNDATAAEMGFLGSFAAFQTANGTNLSSYIGAWGVDPTNDDAWAVLNHSSIFGVIGAPPTVPEPSTWVLLAIGGVALSGLAISKRRARRAALAVAEH